MDRRSVALDQHRAARQIQLIAHGVVRAQKSVERGRLKTLGELEDLYYATCATLKEMTGDLESRIQSGFLDPTRPIHNNIDLMHELAPISTADFLRELQLKYDDLFAPELRSVLEEAVKIKNAWRSLEGRFDSQSVSFQHAVDYENFCKRLSEEIDISRVEGLVHHRDTPVCFIYGELAEKYRHMLMVEDREKRIEQSSNRGSHQDTAISLANRRMLEDHVMPRDQSQSFQHPAFQQLHEHRDIGTERLQKELEKGDTKENEGDIRTCPKHSSDPECSCDSDCICRPCETNPSCDCSCKVERCATRPLPTKHLSSEGVSMSSLTINDALAILDPTVLSNSAAKPSEAGSRGSDMVLDKRQEQERALVRLCEANEVHGLEKFLFDNDEAVKSPSEKSISTLHSPQSLCHSVGKSSPMTPATPWEPSHGDQPETRLGTMPEYLQPKIPWKYSIPQQGTSLYDAAVQEYSKADLLRNDFDWDGLDEGRKRSSWWTAKEATLKLFKRR
ncbi:MAG: hypothetical protein M1825_000095 [Sarcosagium campestre]|nr:MAG: hypothetical protein M1825_000095 [Sarcosagium campestre]